MYNLNSPLTVGAALESLLHIERNDTHCALEIITTDSQLFITKNCCDWNDSGLSDLLIWQLTCVEKLWPGFSLIYLNNFLLSGTFIFYPTLSILSLRIIVNRLGPVRFFCNLLLEPLDKVRLTSRPYLCCYSACLSPSRMI